MSRKAVAMGLLVGCGFAGGFVLSGVASEQSTLPQFRKADPGQLAKKAAGALMKSAAAGASSGKDDGSASAILSEVAGAAGPAKPGTGGNDGFDALAIRPTTDGQDGEAGGKDGAKAGKSLAEQAHQEGKTAPGDGYPSRKTTAGQEPGAGLLMSKAAASDSAGAVAKSADGQSAAGASAMAQGSGAGAMASAGPASAGPCPMADLSGPEAAAVLLGNTVDEVNASSGHEFVYFSPRHLIGRIRPTSVTAKAWDPKAGLLCEGAACRTVHVRRCLEHRLISTTDGDLQLADGRWAPIVRGNVQGFPDYIPFLDGTRTAAKSQPGAPAAGKPGARAGGGAPLDLDRVYLSQRADSGDDRRVSFYDRDGRTMDYAVPAAETVREGVTINMGWWKLQNGLLCQGPAGNVSNPSCYRTKRQGAGRVTLTAEDGAIDLVALADPKPVRPASDN